jgi:hypothetical protein
MIIKSPYLLGCNAVWSGESQQTFRRSMSPPSSRPKSLLPASCWVLACLLFDPDDGFDMFLRNLYWLSPDFTALYLRIQNSKNSHVCVFSVAVFHICLCLCSHKSACHWYEIFLWKLAWLSKYSDSITGWRTIRLSGLDSRRGKRFFFFPQRRDPALWPMMPEASSSEVKLQRRGADWLPTSI